MRDAFHKLIDPGVWRSAGPIDEVRGLDAVEAQGNFDIVEPGGNQNPSSLPFVGLSMHSVGLNGACRP